MKQAVENQECARNAEIPKSEGYNHSNIEGMSICVQKDDTMNSVKSIGCNCVILMLCWNQE